MRTASRKDVVAGVLALAVLGVGPVARGATIYWAGAQYTPGPGYPAAWPTEGSYFDKDNWVGKVLPTDFSSVVIGSDLAMPNGNTGHAPHVIHFGNFGYCGTTVIPGGTVTLYTATILQDNWTFDFGSGQNADFTGTLTPSVGSLSASTLALSPAAGQSAGLTVQNGTLSVGALRVGSDSGQGVVTLSTGACVKTNESTIGVSGAGSFTQTGGTHTNTLGVVLGFNAAATGVYVLNNGIMSSSSYEYIGYSGSGSFTQAGGTHAIAGTLYLGYSLTGSGAYTLSDGVLTAASAEYVGYLGTGRFTQTGGIHTVSGNIGLYLGSTAASSGSYTLSGGQLTVPRVTVVSGSFTQAGGSHTVTDGLKLGTTAGAVGFYVLSDGVLNAKETAVGVGGTGRFMQSGGTHTIDPHGGLTLGSGLGGSGSYALSGGQLTAATENLV